MKRIWNNYILLILCVMLGTSCTEEELGNGQGVLGKEEVWVTLNFGHQDFDSIEITTRSTLGEVAESRVSDMYALIFVNDRCVYNKYFGSDADTKKNTQAEVTNATEECWWVQNRTSETNVSGNSADDTHGTIRMKTPVITGGELYLIANANAYTVNISPEKLGTVRTKEDLQDLTAQLNGEVVTRYGYFPMVAELTGINIASTGITQTVNSTTITNVVAELVRLDAKVDVNVVAAKGTSSTYGTGSEQVGVIVNEFTPLSWQIMNVPKGSFLLEQGGTTTDVVGFFNTLPTQFEKTSTSGNTTQHSFSFYMLENNQTSTGVTDYHQRDRRKKSNGVYLYPLPEDENDEKDIWEYAPENSTYLILKGYLSMNPTNAASGTQEIGADVTYYIHLGDFINSTQTATNALNNFSVERNTHYTFNITIKGVRNIELEVTEQKENQSGATGNIYATKEVIKQLDAHYEQFTLFISENDITENNMTWYTSTPFSEGSPKLNDGLEQGSAAYNTQLANYDYKWVWFMVNPLNNAGTAYVTTNQWYPGNQYRTGGTEGKTLGDEGHLMNVDEFVQFLKEEKNKTDNKFKNGGIAVTVFVDEFYYEKHPIDNTAQEGLWKKFVNTPSRLLHILSGSNKSLDGESSITTSLITIKQKSIETPYNINKSSLATAWGCETVDEFRDSQLWLYSVNESNNKSNNLPNGITAFSGNTSLENGRYNTAVMWGLLSNGAWNFIDWETYLNYQRENDYQSEDYNLYWGFMADGKETHLSAVLQRNRDNNGNKTIDADEVRWYIASIKQLYGIYIGGLGLNTETQLYTKEMANSSGSITSGPYAPIGDGVAAQKWQNHVISSSKGDNHPIILWAEQGLSISDYRQDIGWGEMGPYQIRCVRNLGLDYSDEESAKDAIVDEGEHPQALINYQVKNSSGTVIAESAATSTSIYEFDLSNVNESSLRSSPTVMELWPSDEFDYNARVYSHFRTAPSTVSIGTGQYLNLNTYYTSLRNYLTGTSSTSNYAGNEVEGYRVPNIREAAIMGIYCQNNSWWNSGQTLVGTYSYRNSLGLSNNQTWAFCYSYASMAAHWQYNLYVRPVQDYDSASE